MKAALSIPVLAALAAGVVSAQGLPYKFDLPSDSPVLIKSGEFSCSRATAAGGIRKIDVCGSLSLVNTTQRHIRGLTLSFSAPGASGSDGWSRSNLDIGPGQIFTVKIEAPPLLPPVGSAVSIVVRLEGVLFDDLTFYGSDLRARRMLTRLALEAQTVREYYRNLLRKSRETLANEVLASISTENERRSSNPGVQIAQGRAANLDLDHEVQVAFVSIPNSPVEATTAKVNVSPSEVRAPRVTFRNLSSHPVRHVDTGWIIKDQLGREFYAASLPADVAIGANQSAEVREDNALRFGRPVSIQSVTAYVSGVEFADGKQWIPPHAAFANGALRQVPASPEEQRLLGIYNRYGLDALIEELSKF